MLLQASATASLSVFCYTKSETVYKSFICTHCSLPTFPPLEDTAAAAAAEIFWLVFDVVLVPSSWPLCVESIANSISSSFCKDKPFYLLTMHESSTTVWPMPVSRKGHSLGWNHCCHHQNLYNSKKIHKIITKAKNLLTAAIALWTIFFLMFTSHCQYK